jgi:hypothetical protein
MDWGSVGSQVLQVFINALPVIVGGGGVVFLVWYAFKHPDSSFVKYYGLVIQAVRLVEKGISDETPNKALSKADLFLKTFISLYEQNEKATPSDALKAWALRTKEVVLIELEKVKLTKKEG